MHDRLSKTPSFYFVLSVSVFVVETMYIMWLILPLIQRISSFGNIQRISSFVISRIYTQIIQLFSTTWPPGCLTCVIWQHITKKKKIGHGDQVLPSPAWNYPKMSLFEQSEVLIDTFPPKKLYRLYRNKSLYSNKRLQCVRLILVSVWKKKSVQQ